MHYIHSGLESWMMKKIYPSYNRIKTTQSKSNKTTDLLIVIQWSSRTGNSTTVYSKRVVCGHFMEELSTAWSCYCYANKGSSEWVIWDSGRDQVYATISPSLIWWCWSMLFLECLTLQLVSPHYSQTEKWVCL